MKQVSKGRLLLNWKTLNLINATLTIHTHNSRHVDVVETSCLSSNWAGNTAFIETYIENWSHYLGIHKLLAWLQGGIKMPRCFCILFQYRFLRYQNLSMLMRDRLRHCVYMFVSSRRKHTCNKTHFPSPLHPPPPCKHSSSQEMT